MRSLTRFSGAPLAAQDGRGARGPLASPAAGEAAWRFTTADGRTVTETSTAVADPADNFSHFCANRAWTVQWGARGVAIGTVDHVEGVGPLPYSQTLSMTVATAGEGMVVVVCSSGF